MPFYSHTHPQIINHQASATGKVAVKLCAENQGKIPIGEGGPSPTSFVLSVSLNLCIHQRVRPTSFLRFPVTLTNAPIVNITNSAFKRTI